MTITFRDVPRPSDCAAVKNIIESSGFFYAHEIDVAVELLEIRLSEGENSDYKFIFAELNNEVVGYACYGQIACTKSSFDLYWIAINNNQRGNGIGKKILSEMYNKIKVLGGTAVYAETSERDLYIPTRKFYENCGYIKEAVIKDFYDKGDSKAIYVYYL